MTRQYIGEIGSGAREKCIRQAVDLQEDTSCKVIILSDDKKLCDKFKVRKNYPVELVAFYDLKQDDETIFFKHRGKDIIYLFDNIEYLETINSYIYDYLDYAIDNGFNIFLYSQGDLVEKMSDFAMSCRVLQNGRHIKNNNYKIVDFSLEENDNPSIPQPIKDHLEAEEKQMLQIKYIEEFILLPSATTLIKKVNRSFEPQFATIECKEIRDNGIYYTVEDRGIPQEFVFLKDFNVSTFESQRTLITQKNTLLLKKEELAEAEAEMPTESKLTKIETEWNIINPLKVEIEKLTKEIENFDVIDKLYYE